MVKASTVQIIDYGHVKRGQLGILAQDITPSLRQAFRLKNGQQGVLVSRVEDGSPAERAGIRSGDIIVAINDESINSTGQLRNEIGF